MLLSAEFYRRETRQVAQELLGKTLTFTNSKGQSFSGRIVETEAYLGIADPACHTFQGRRTDRVKSMYLDGGHAYIYLIYGIHHCFNVVTRDNQHPEAVLIRGLEPLNPLNLNPNGPGKLCAQFGLTKKQDGLPLFSASSPLRILDDGFRCERKDLVKAPRIGVAYAGEAALWPLRYFLKGNPYVSRKK